MSAVCPTCRDELRPTTYPGAEHQEGPVRAFAEPRRGSRCATGCGPDVLEAIGRALDDRLVIASRTRRPRSDDRCGECGTVLDLPLRATTRSLTVETVGGAPFTVTLDLPLGRCPECGCDNVPSALGDVVRRATTIVAGGAMDAGPDVRKGPRDGAEVSRRRRRVGRGSPDPA